MLKSIHKNRTLMGCIYALIMLLPLSSVLFRCAYTIFNKNAFESYYGETINQTTTESVLYDNLIVGNNYDIYVGGKSYNANQSRVRFAVSNVSRDLSGNHIDYPSCNIIQFEPYNNTMQWLLLNGGAYVSDYNFSGSSTAIYHFTFLGKINDNDFLSEYDNFIYTSYNEYSYLDNAFEYSIHNFVGRNGRGVLNLTDWFVDVFLQRSNHTMLYIDFVNWYMNYTLLVSCVYLLYLVLMWFVNLARRLLTSFDVDRRV